MQDIVAYLRDNLRKFPVDQLREQLSAEGVSEAEIDAALKVALRAPAVPRAKSNPLAKFFLFGGVLCVAVSAFLAVQQHAPQPEPAGGAETAPAGPQVGSYVSQAHGYVIKLPSEYVAAASFRDARKLDELVYFCKKGTDPSNFLNDGLYGQLGIVRLQVHPSPLAGNLNALAAITNIVSARAQQNGEKFTLKNLQVSSMNGLQVTYDVPFPRVEAYIIGEKVLYTFLAGQDDETFREILLSLRDARSEI